MVHSLGAAGHDGHRLMSGCQLEFDSDHVDENVRIFAISGQVRNRVSSDELATWRPAHFTSDRSIELVNVNFEAHVNKCFLKFHNVVYCS